MNRSSIFAFGTLLLSGPLLGAFAITVSAGVSTAQEVEAPTQSKTVPVIANGEAQVVDGFSNRQDWIRHDLFVETDFDTDGDGKLDRMHVSVTRQKQTDTEGLKVPVVYESSPYFSGTGSANAQAIERFFWNPRHEVGAKPSKHETPPPIPHRPRRPSMSGSQVRTWVPRGYAVVHSASPGTGLSQGCPTVGGENESMAPKAVIDWLCGRAKGYTEAMGGEEVKAFWCTGKVGMTGTSYNGTLPLAAATTGVQGLEAIIPIAPNTLYYHYYRSNGLVRHPGGYRGEDIDVLYNFIASGPMKSRDYCDARYRDKEMAEGFDRTTGDYNDFWAGRDYLNKLGPLKAATLMSHAFNDWNVMPEHSVRIYEALKKKGVPCQAFFHQGGHGGPPPLKQMNRWFTRYLFGAENGVEKDPKSWIVREGVRRDRPTPYPEYPHPDALPVTLYPTGVGSAVGGLATTKAPDRTPETLIDNVTFTGSMLAAEADSKHRLLYATPELTAPVHLSGYAKVKIKLASSKPAANLSIWVVSLPFTRTRDINSNIITRGWADPQNHKSLTEGEPLQPRQYYELSFNLQPDDQVIPAGQKIGLMIFSSDRDFTLWPQPGTELTIDLNATSIQLPVVGGTAAFGKALDRSGN